MPGLEPGSLGWVVHRDFAAAVRELGHSFDMLTTTPARQSGGDVVDVGTLPMSTLWQRLAGPAAPFLRTRQLLPAAAAFAKYLRRAGDSIDLLHIEVAYPHGTAATLAAVAARWRGPLVVMPAGEDTLIISEDHYGFRRYPLPNALMKWTLRRAAYIRCVSPLLETWIADLAPDTPRRVAPQNVSAETAAAAEEPSDRRAERRRRARRALDADFATEGKPLIVSLGRLHPFKSIDVLIRAMAAVPDAHLLIVGPSLTVRPRGDTAAQLLALAEEVGVGNRVQWVGPVPPQRALDVLAGADVLAVPSRLESLNKVCVEAAAVGTPFVVTRTTGISAWVPESGAGIVVPPGDTGALAEALTAMLTGRWRPDLQGSAALVRRFSPRTVAAEVVDIYESVVASRPRGPAPR